MWLEMFLPSLLLWDKTDSSLLSIILNLSAAMSATPLFVFKCSSWSRHQSMLSKVSTPRIPRTLVAPASEKGFVLEEKVGKSFTTLVFPFHVISWHPDTYLIIWTCQEKLCWTRTHSARSLWAPAWTPSWPGWTWHPSMWPRSVQMGSQFGLPPPWKDPYQMNCMSLDSTHPGSWSKWLICLSTSSLGMRYKKDSLLCALFLGGPDDSPLLWSCLKLKIQEDEE
jgi:hypothetical protein